MKSALALASGALALTACATTDTEAPSREVADTCQAEAGQRFVGQRASPETGAAIMAATQSTRLRWVPPHTVVTLEYAFGRVTVAYDDDYRITTVSCS